MKTTLIRAAAAVAAGLLTTLLFLAGFRAVASAPTACPDGAKGPASEVPAAGGIFTKR